MVCGTLPVSVGNRRQFAEGSESLVAISVSLHVRSPYGVGENAVMTDCSKSCGRLPKLTMAISNMFFGKL